MVAIVSNRQEGSGLPYFGGWNGENRIALTEIASEKAWKSCKGLVVLDFKRWMRWLSIRDPRSACLLSKMIPVFR